MPMKSIKPVKKGYKAYIITTATHPLHVSFFILFVPFNWLVWLD